eukprot:Plantae.Rhodophyta-Palmaria_palmata.ctg8877.p1 GENE.Plantae.Rhodophyta-Palmaria_palmata.ctg8877~~Plantae.Rhodophyta-Palmaria_palmata.ctg8877.p1  ORF type:complete len:173 (-),score=18.85 Plantae.Rhodophyta-Palmaria_palmata.ctg8877:553-1071(-)
MAVGEVAKVFLFIVQWIWTACVAFIFPDQLIGESPLKSSSAKVCLFDRQQDLSRCNFGMAWGLLALFILTGTLIWYSLNFCTSIRLPPNLEVVVFAWLALWWFIGAIILSAVKAKAAKSGATTVVVFAWMLVIFSALSAFLASRTSNYYQGGFPVETDDTLTKREYADSVEI